MEHHHHDQGENHHKCDHHKKHGGGDQHHQDLEDFLPKLISMMSWEKNENILDYGCGPGTTGFNYILPQVVKFDSKLFSVDVNEKKVELAKVKCAHPSITYAVGNILEEFPFGNVKLDKIFAIYVFHFVPDLKKAFSRLNSLLKPGGQICFTMHKTSYFNALRGIAESDRWKLYLKDYHKFSSELAFEDSDSGPETYKNLLEESGFNVTFTESLDRESHCEDMEKYLDSAISQLPFIDNIPKELRDEFKEDYRGVVTSLAGIPRDSKQYVKKYKCVAVVGEKQ